MKEMIYDFIAVAVVVLLIATFVIGKSDSIQSNLTALAKSNTATITELTD